MKKCLLKAMLLAMFMVLVAFAWGQSVFYEEPFDTNNGWTLGSNWSIESGALKLGWSPTTTNYDLSATSPNIVVPATAGDMVVSQYIDEYTGMGNPPETFEIIAVAGGTDNILWSYSQDNDWGVTGGQDLTVSLAPYAGQTIQLKFRSHGETTFNFNSWFIYDIKAYASLNSDLAATSLTGSGTPAINSAHPYVITVRNAGLTAVSNYTVKLMQTGDVELGSVTGTTLAPQGTAEHTIHWTPTVLGETQIWGKVVLTGDENPNNNETDHMTVTVMEAGLLVAGIGTGTATNTNTGAPAPYGTYWKAFRQQLLYTADDFFAAGAAPGLISALAFNVQSLDACGPMTNYTIRLKHTDQAALTATFELGDYTTVWQRDTFMPTVAWNIHNFDTPFMWDGASNLIVEIVTDMVATFDRNALVYFSTTDYASSVRYQSDSNNGLTGTTGTTSMNRSNIRFFMTVDGMGSINGTVTAGGSPLEGAEIAVENTLFTAVSGADGTYNLPFVPEGAQTVTASKHGYADVTHTVTVVEDQATTQDFALTLLPQVAVTGRIVGSDAPTLGIEGASITLSGYEAYEAITDASGQFSIPSVFSGHTYNYTAAAIGYAVATGEVEVGSAPVNMGDITVNEVAYAPYGVVATESDNYQSVNVSWEVPVPGGSSFEDDFESYDDFATVFGDWTTVDVDGSDTYGFSGISFPGSGSAMSYIIFNPTMTVPPLEDNPGHSGDKYAACFASTTPPNNDWLITPQVMGGGVASFWARTYMDYGMERFKVGVSTTGTAPADFTIISGANYVEAPLTWTEFTYDLSAYAGQQIYVGVQCVSNDCFIFFVDDFYVGDARIRTASESMQSSASSVANHTMGRTAERAIVTPNPVKIISPSPRNTSRALMGYKVYRLLAADQANENNWTTLTANTITPTQYADNGWGPLPSGVYKYAVKAVYTNDVMSPAAFSAELHKGMMGTLSGTVTEFGTDLPVEGANVSAGEYSGTTNASGEYSFTIYAGTYEVSASKPGYQAATQANVVIQGTQTTTLDFVLTEITLPPGAVQAEEAGANVNLTWLEPGSGAEITEGFEGPVFPPEDWTQTITNTGAAGTIGVFPTWCRFGSVNLDPVVPPHNGAYQAGLWWANDHQDEWFKTPAFNCLPNASLTFWGYIFLGSTHGDHYYVKVSTNGGSSWTTLWDASTQAGGWNYYATPIVIDLAAYAGQEIMLAWQAEDPSSNDGLWYVWFMDDIHIGTPTRTISLNSDINARHNPSQMPKVHNVSLPASRAAVDNPGIQEESLSFGRALDGYKVWRLLQGQESNEAQWTALTTDPISTTAYQDTGWDAMPDGTYKWAVKTVYTGGALSNSAFSNALRRLTEIGTVAGFVKDMNNQPINGATIATGEYSTTSNANGVYTMAVPAGTHSLVASHPNYSAMTQTGVIVVTGQTTTVNFQLPPSTIVLEDGFETYADFATTFAPWILLDVDQSNTYGFTAIDFPGAYDPMAYIIFNPSTTVPPTADAEPHTGSKYAACFAAVLPPEGAGPNNDWMITPQFSGGGEIRFWVRTFHPDYGLEEYNVGVSTTGTNPNNFTLLNGSSPSLAPLEWTEVVYDLSAYANQQIYVGIQCVSNDHFVFMVDDVKITSAVSNEDGVAPVYTTALKGNYPNPFNPETTISYSVKEAGPVSIEIYNVKGQLVRKLVNDVRAAGDHTVVWNGSDNNGRAVSSGIYYFKMNTGKYSSTKKMIMMK